MYIYIYIYIYIYYIKHIYKGKEKNIKQRVLVPCRK